MPALGSGFHTPLRQGRAEAVVEGERDDSCVGQRLAAQ
jgi:hypothetical protein